MNPNDPNVAMLEVVAEALGDELRRETVFIGGAAAGLLITDPAMPAIRPTDDVDLVFEALALTDYHRFERRLRTRGFTQDASAGAPICRWRVAGITVDVMPTIEEVLGFSNRWYPHAIETATPEGLPSGRKIRLIVAPAFVATKLEAFDGRGNRNFLFSHDVGDLLAVVDGRDALVEECRQSAPELRAYLRERFTRLLATPSFVESLAGHLPGDAASQERLPELEARLRLIAALDSS